MRGKLMRLFTQGQHEAILNSNPLDADAAKAYALVAGETITPQNVRYWRKLFVDNAGNMAKTDRELKEDRKVRQPEPCKSDVSHPKKVYRCILHIPDQHAPYQHQDAIPFLMKVSMRYKPDLIVNAGDELDFHAMSFHDSDPNLDSAGAELEKGKEWLHQLHKLFPDMLICDSNHGSMAFRRAKAHGLPVQLIKSYREVVFPDGGGEGWHWAESWRVKTRLGDVLFKHQASGSILADAAHNACNLMVGHNHGNYSVEYTASSSHLYWGAFGGCLIDKDSYAFAYGKHSLRKPVIGCTVILDGRPMLIPMVLNKDGRWNGKL